MDKPQKHDKNGIPKASRSNGNGKLKPSSKPADLMEQRSSKRVTRMSRSLSPIFVARDQPLFDGAPSHRPTKKVIAFGWYGGKFSCLDWLLPRLPKCHHYCEPFAGSAAVLLNRDPSPVETYNDVDGEVVNFFRVLRDKPEELVRAIGLTPLLPRRDGARCCKRRRWLFRGREGTPFLCTGSTSPHGTRPDSFIGALGQL